MYLVVPIILIYVAYLAAFRFSSLSSDQNRFTPNFIVLTIGIVLILFLAFVDAAIYWLFEEAVTENLPDIYMQYYADFALHSFLLSLILFSLIRLVVPARAGFMVALLSGLISYFLISAGLGNAISAQFTLAEYEFSDFINSLSDIDEWIFSGWFLRGLAIYPIASAVILSIAFPASKQSNNQAHNNINTGGDAVAFKDNSNEPLRLVAGLAACGRLPGQNSLETEINHPVQATPHPIDIDRGVILGIVQNRQQKQLVRSFVYAGLAIIGFALSVATESPLGVFLAIIAAAILFFRTLQDDKYHIAKDYKPDVFDQSKILPNTPFDRNLVVYAGDNPFANFGTVFGRWILSVDKKRAKAGDALNGANVTANQVNITDIQTDICNNLKGSGLEEKHIKTLYFAQGKNIPEQIKRPGPHRPPSQIQADQVRDLINYPDSPIREYLWVRKNGWGREISTSYFIRLVEVQDDINLEISGVLMSPIAEAHRWVDKIPPRRFRQIITDMIYSIFGGIGLMIWSPLYLFGLFQLTLGRIFTDPEKAIIRTVEQQPDYDFGAPVSLRKSLSDPATLSYFQNTDRKMTEAAFTGRILRAFIDALDQKNIDTSELREQRTTLLNQGVIVQGGDLKANNVAAGIGSKINSVASRISGGQKGSVKT